jgi:uncharacterized membrane protein
MMSLGDGNQQSHNAIDTASIPARNGDVPSTDLSMPPPSGALTEAIAASSTDSVLGNLPIDQLVGLMTQLSRSEETTGVLPPPSFLKAYQEVYDDAPKILFDAFQRREEMLLAEQLHRHRIEDRESLNSERRADRGQIYAVYLIGGMITAAFVVMIVAAFVHEPFIGASGATAILAIAGVVGATIYRSRADGPTFHHQNDLGTTTHSQAISDNQPSVDDPS